MADLRQLWVTLLAIPCHPGTPHPSPGTKIDAMRALARQPAPLQLQRTTRPAAKARTRRLAVQAMAPPKQMLVRPCLLPTLALPPPPPPQSSRSPTACLLAARASSTLLRAPPLRPQIYVPPHPLVKHWLGVLRNKDTPPAIFRSAAAELGRILIYEAARDWLPTVDAQVQTPLGIADATFVDPMQPIKVRRRAQAWAPLAAASGGACSLQRGLRPLEAAPLVEGQGWR